MEADAKTLEGRARTQASVQATIIMNSRAVFAIEVPRCAYCMTRRFTEVSHNPEPVPEEHDISSACASFATGNALLLR
jgi:hypothetical protein